MTSLSLLRNENFHKEFGDKPGDPIRRRNEYLEQLEREKKDEDEKDEVHMADGEMKGEMREAKEKEKGFNDEGSSNEVEN